MSNAYRENAAPESGEPESGEYVGGGKLDRHGIRTSHNCNPPGWWSRWWHEVKLQDTWTCTCGTVWKFTLWKDTYRNGEWANGTSNVWTTAEGAWRP